MRSYLLFVSLLLFQSICLGQLSNDVFFNFTSENSNFPAGNIIENFSEQDNGIVWMGSRNGLYRFDGIEFRNLSKYIFDELRPTGNYISCQYLNGNLLYAGTINAGFFVLDVITLKAKQINLIDSSTGNNFSVRFIFADKDDSLWIGTNKEAVIKMHKTNFGKRILHLAASANEGPKVLPNFKKIIPSLHQTENYWALEENAVWLINKRTGQYKKYFNNNSNPFMPVQNPIEFTDMFLASDSIAWLSSFNNGLYKWNYLKDEFELYYPSNLNRAQKNIGLNAIIPNGANELFISSSSFGLLLFNRKTGSFEKYESAPSKNLSIPNGGSRAIYTDKKGALWISFLNAVSYRHPDFQQVKKIKLPPDYKNERVQHLQSIENNKIFTSIENNRGSFLYDEVNSSWIKLPAFKNENGNQENSTVFYSNNINGEWLFKPGWSQFFNLENNYTRFVSNNFITNPQILSAYKINGIAATNKKVVLTGKEAIIIFDKELNKWQLHKMADHDDSLHIKGLQNPVADKTGNVWMQSQAGLSVYEAEKNIFKEISYRTKKEYEGLQYITDLLVNKEGSLVYASTKENGIFVFNTQTKELVNHYNISNSLPQNHIYHIALSNADSLLWAAAYQSITRLNINNKESRTYDDKNSPLLLKQGFFSFTVTDNGAVYAADTLLYNFTVGKKQKNILQPFVSGYRYKNNWIPGATIINLPKENSFVEVFIGSANYADKAHEKIYYSVDGDKDWNEAENGKIILTSLKNGSTSLSVKVINNGINAAEGFTNMKIERAKYFYQTWWFVLALILATIGILLFIFQQKIKSVREREREKAAIEITLSELEMASLRSQMNPHFLFNSLSSLRYLVMTKETKKATQFIVKLSKLLRRILNHSQQQTISLQDELEALKLYLEIESLRFENGFTYVIDEAEIEDLYQVEIPPLLLQPIVENAIKHGLVNSELKEKYVRIKVQQLPNETVEIIISDNGIGRENAASLKKYSASNSLGNSLTEQRIVLFNKTHNAKLSWKVNDLTADNENPGTIVKIIYNNEAAKL